VVESSPREEGEVSNGFKQWLGCWIRAISVSRTDVTRLRRRWAAGRECEFRPLEDGVFGEGGRPNDRVLKTPFNGTGAIGTSRGLKSMRRLILDVLGPSRSRSA
jgi:hypothetical protein